MKLKLSHKTQLDAKYLSLSIFLSFSVSDHRTLKTEGDVSAREEEGPDDAAPTGIPDSREGYDTIPNPAHAIKEIKSKSRDGIHMTASLAESSDDVTASQNSYAENQDKERLSDGPEGDQEKSSGQKVTTDNSKNGQSRLNRPSDQRNDRKNQLRHGKDRQRTKRPRAVHADRFYPPWEQNSQGDYDITQYHKGSKVRIYEKQQQYSRLGDDSTEFVDANPYVGGDNARTYDSQQQYSGQGSDPRYDTRIVDDCNHEGREPSRCDNFYRNKYRFMKSTCSPQQREQKMISQLEGEAEEKE